MEQTILEGVGRGPVVQRPLYALRWKGGKSAGAPTGIGPWVASQLPMRAGYVEPFAGMLGVLLARPPARFEVVNDLDSRVVNWWRVVRDRGEDLERLWESTPWSRQELAAQVHRMDDPDPLRRALACTVVWQQRSTIRDSGSWYRTVTPKHPIRRDLNLTALKDRLRRVQVEHRDALQLLRETVDVEDVTIYADPPYASSEEGYGVPFRAEPLAELLRAQAGFVALSGQVTDPYDDLLPGWRKTVKAVWRKTAARNAASAHVECLWSNFDPHFNPYPKEPR